jgi:hypothetical protein
MLVCSYCGRHFKHDFESCPGCGSGSFKRINDIKEMVIEKPPKDGYKISTDSYEKEKKINKIIKYVFYGIVGFSIISSLPFIIIFLFMLVMILLSLVSIVEVEEIGGMIVFLLIFGIIIISDFIMCGGTYFLFKIVLDNQKKKIENDIIRVNKLAKEGMLIKNMPYELVESGNIIMGKPIYSIKVDFKFENGTVIPLISNPKFDGIDRDKNNSADLLIDKKDYSNYYIDFEIY